MSDKGEYPLFRHNIGHNREQFLKTSKGNIYGNAAVQFVHLGKTMNNVFNLDNCRKLTMKTKKTHIYKKSLEQTINM